MKVFSMIVQHLAIQNAIHQSHLFMRNSFSSVFGFQNDYNVSYQKVTMPYSKGIYIGNTVYENFKASCPIYLSLTFNPIFLVVEKSSFAHCENGDLGGAIYFKNYGGGIILDKICAYCCFCYGLSINAGQVARIHLFSNEQVRINTTSITKCPSSYLDKDTREPISIFFGDLIVNQANFSKNYLKYTSAMYTWNLQGCLMSFSSFKEGFASISILLRLTSALSSNIHWIKKVNFVLNQSPGTGSAIISSGNVQTNISECIFIDNYGALFTCTDPLTSMTIHNNYFKLIPQFPIFQATVNVRTSNNVQTSVYTQTIPYAHFFTYYCDVEYQQLNVEETICPAIPPSPTACDGELPDESNLFSVIKFVIPFIHFIYHI